MNNEILLEVTNISKHFGETQALSDVSVVFRKGTTHSLVGRNGAGKSTLVNIIAGLIRQDSGGVVFDGEEMKNLSLADRQHRGIYLVPQHASIVPDMTVAENLALGIWPKSTGLVSWKKMNIHAEEILREFKMDLDPKALVRFLSPVDQRKLNIVKALFSGGKLIILDEPTTSLAVEDRENLFEFVKTYEAKGITFILISHYLEEVLNVSDDITVIRDGLSFKGELKDADSQEELASLIAGEEVELTHRNVDKVINDEVTLRCENLSAQYLQPVTLDFHKGEIVGVVGFPGSGAREMCKAMYGIIPKHGGDVYVSGKQMKISSEEHGLAAGITYLPEDRHAYGIVPIMSIRQNMGLSSLNTKLKKSFGFMNLKKEESIARHAMQALKIKAASIEAPANSLSGGNQQKVVLGKVLACDPKVLIMDEPTIGIDIKSREEIMKQIQTLTDEMGLTVLYLTNDFDELLRISDRVVIFSEGNVVANMPNNEELTPEKIIEIRDKKMESVI